MYKRIAAVGTARVKREDWADRLSESGRVELLDDDELRACADDLPEAREGRVHIRMAGGGADQGGGALCFQ